MVSSVLEPSSKSDLLVLGIGVFAELSSTWLYIDEAELNVLDTTCSVETIRGAISILIEHGAIYND
jgi:hypothetical protein